MEKEFDYRRDVRFKFDGYRMNTDACLSAESEALLAAGLTEGSHEEYKLSSGSIAECAEMYVDANTAYIEGVHDAHAKRGEDRAIDIFSGDVRIASCSIAVYVDSDAVGLVMPNGDVARNLSDYTWDDFEKLEDMM